MSACALLAALAAAAAGPDDKVPKPPGHGWEEYEAKDSQGNPQGKAYHRPLTGTMSRGVQGEGTGYSIKLDGKYLGAFQRDDNTSVNVFLRDHNDGRTSDLEYIVNFDAKGKPTYRLVSFDSDIYIDLDGDGRFDCGFEDRGVVKAPWILVDGRHFGVQDRRMQFEQRDAPHVAYGRDGADWLHYRFKDGKWRLTEREPMRGPQLEPEPLPPAVPGRGQPRPKADPPPVRVDPYP